MKAEYVALSLALRAFLPLQWLIEEIIKETKCDKLTKTKLHSTVFEDNMGCYLLATNHRITNRTKYYLSKYHWFWDLYKCYLMLAGSTIKLDYEDRYFQVIVGSISTNSLSALFRWLCLCVRSSNMYDVVPIQSKNKLHQHSHNCLACSCYELPCMICQSWQATLICNIHIGCDSV